MSATTSDLFSESLFHSEIGASDRSGQPTAIQLPAADADIQYFPNFVSRERAEEMLATLIAELQWREESITLFGKRHKQPRLFAWHGDEAARYRYSGLSLQPLPWLPLLSELRQRVQQHCGEQFNSVLANYYRDENDCMGMHADNEPELGPEPAIASLSFGEQRVFRLKHQHRPELKPIKLPLESGSLLLMRGSTQAHWKHGIARQKKPCAARLNLTFRQILRN